MFQALKLSSKRNLKMYEASAIHKLDGYCYMILSLFEVLSKTWSWPQYSITCVQPNANTLCVASHTYVSCYTGDFVVHNYNLKTDKNLDEFFYDNILNKQIIEINTFPFANLSSLKPDLFS